MALGLAAIRSQRASDRRAASQPGQAGGVPVDAVALPPAAAVVASADGVHSVVRDWVTGGDEPVYSGTSGFRGLVPAERRRDAGLARLTDDLAWIHGYDVLAPATGRRARCSAAAG